MTTRRRSALLASLSVTALAVLNSCTSPPVAYAIDSPPPHQHSPLSWSQALSGAIKQLSNTDGLEGKGCYSTRADAHYALRSCFGFGMISGKLYYMPSKLTPSFCSGAVHIALLSALMHWDSTHPEISLSKEDWDSMLPGNVQDGEGVWGWANANAAGFANLIHKLGAGYSFTNPAQARRHDIIKIWWTNEIGGKERGHLAFLIKQDAEHYYIWGSHQRDEKGQEGIYTKQIAKSDVARVLFTRITQPAAFQRAEDIGFDPWLNALLYTPVSWEETLRRAGVTKR